MAAFQSLVFVPYSFFVPMRTLTSLFHVAMTGVTASEKMLDFLNEDTNIENGSHTFEKNAPINVKAMNYYYPLGHESHQDSSNS